MTLEELRSELRARLQRALRDDRRIVLAEYWQIVALAEAIAALEMSSR